MVKVEAKTPNKRKSLGAFPTPKVLTPKVETNKTPKVEKTPGKQKNVKTPQLGKTPVKQEPSSPKRTPAKTNPTPKVKRSSESESESPTKKLKKFAGTTKLNGDSPKPKKEAKINVKTKGVVAEKKKKGQFFNIDQKIKSGKSSEVLNEIELKIQQIANRKELTKTAKRKLKVLRKLKAVAENGGVLPESYNASGESKTGLSVSKKRRLRKKRMSEKAGETEQVEVKTKAKETVKKVKKENPKQQQAKQKTQAAKPKGVAAKPIIKKEDSDDDEDDGSSESDYDVEKSVIPQKVLKTEPEEEDDSDDDDDDDDAVEEEESDDDDDDDEDGEEEDDDVEVGEEASDDDDEDDDDDDEEEGDDDEDDDEEEASEEPQPAPPKKQKVAQPVTNGESGKKRFVLFVGNLPYDATKEQISEHFKKVGKIRDIRIPNDVKTNKPRGFAYVEVENEIAYQKALSLHHSQINGRRINVQYSEGGKKKGEDAKNKIKQKNFKLHAMRKQGQLAGSFKNNQKRAQRRGKANANKAD